MAWKRRQVPGTIATSAEHRERRESVATSSTVLLMTTTSSVSTMTSLQESKKRKWMPQLPPLRQRLVVASCSLQAATNSYYRGRLRYHCPHPLSCHANFSGGETTHEVPRHRYSRAADPSSAEAPRSLGASAAVAEEAAVEEEESDRCREHPGWRTSAPTAAAASNRQRRAPAAG